MQTQKAAANNARKYALRCIRDAIRRYRLDHNSDCGDLLDSSGKPLLSWRVLLLPYLGEQEAKLFERFRLEEPWDSEHNSQLIALMPPDFDEPYNRYQRITPTGYTRYILVSSLREIRSDKLQLEQVRQNYIAIVGPINQATVWTRPDDSVIDLRHIDDLGELVGISADGAITPVVAKGELKGIGIILDDTAGGGVHLATCGGGLGLIVGGYAYHVLDRANGRLRLFKKEADFAAFEQVLLEAFERVPVRILGYAVMSNHRHLVVWLRQRQDGQVTDFFRWLTHAHTQRWHAHHGTSGMGHLYQGRFKSFPIAFDEHLAAVLRYIERNPLRAGLVERAEAWRWGSLYRRMHGTADERALLAESPVKLGRLWYEHVNDPQNEAELAAIRRCIARAGHSAARRGRRRLRGS